MKTFPVLSWVGSRVQTEVDPKWPNITDSLKSKHCIATRYPQTSCPHRAPSVRFTHATSCSNLTSERIFVSRLFASSLKNLFCMVASNFRCFSRISKLGRVDPPEWLVSLKTRYSIPCFRPCRDCITPESMHPGEVHRVLVCRANATFLRDRFC
ncbi:hypothetical protein F5I97DRAFT_691526 [Phlebopus sp. FC_14]|nr:hypothetical protein F5I97DRAFT_691526 [Phlebopus sp. FC_14]